MQIARVAILHIFGLGIAAVKESFGPRLGAPVPLATVAERIVYDLGVWSL